MSLKNNSCRDKVECAKLAMLGSPLLMQAEYHHQVFNRHMHDGYAFGVITAGQLDFFYQHKNWHAQPGNISLVVPGEVHDGCAADQAYGWSYRMMYLMPDALGQVNEALTGKSKLPYFLPGVINDAGLAKKFLQLYSCLTNPNSVLLERDSLYWQWLAEFITVYESSGLVKAVELAKENYVVKLIKDYLQENYWQNITLSDLAKVGNLSPWYLLRVFADTVGLPPHLYQQQVRISRAKEFLSKGASLAAVAMQTGFVDQSHFSRQFKRITGMTPGQYQSLV